MCILCKLIIELDTFCNLAVKSLVGRQADFLICFFGLFFLGEKMVRYQLVHLK